MTTVILRADSSLSIGTGHVVRCLTLADELRRGGARAVFVTRLHDGHMAESIKSRGYDCLTLPKLASDGFRAVAPAEDADATLAALSAAGIKGDWVVVDHYGLDEAWESRLRRVAVKVLVIDDLFDRRHDCDMLVNQSSLLGEYRYAPLVPKGARILFGPKFALLRPQFAKAHGRGGAAPRVERLLVFFGGVDKADVTATAIRAVGLLAEPPRFIDVVVGAQYPYRDRLAKQLAAMPGTTLHVQVADPAPLMQAADLALGAGGTTTWERCCLGLPSVVVAVAENQYELAQTMANQGYLYYVGPIGTVTEEILARALVMLADPNVRDAYVKKGTSLVDGHGVTRVVTEMKEMLG